MAKKVKVKVSKPLSDNLFIFRQYGPVWSGRKHGHGGRWGPNV